ncbi:MAG: nuclear transport factor 2 family protein [Verrucomicrobia bacterium]|nr:nuclear transport factor 2 family protein [Verrucomicrobiota bacterium]
MYPLVPLGKKVEEAFNNNDAVALAALYTEDGIKVTDQGPMHGRQAIEKWLAEVFKTLHPKNYIDKIDSLRIIGTADNIAANGEWSQTLQGKNGEPISVKGYWAAIYVREGDDWKCRLDAFNLTPDSWALIYKSFGLSAATPSATTTPSSQ